MPHALCLMRLFPRRPFVIGGFVDLVGGALTAVRREEATGMPMRLVAAPGD